MRIRPLATTTAAVALALTSLATPAHAAGTITISADPTTLHPGDQTTVSGETADPPCATDGVTVTLSYTKPNGNLGTVSTSAITEADGSFEATVTVPDTAVAGEAAGVQATIADCTDDGGATRASETEKLTIEAYEGSFDTNKETGKPGTKVHFTGDNCWGGQVQVVFTDGEDADEADAVLKADKTFSGDYVIPDAPSGEYAFVASCPGTDYEVMPFVLVNPQASPTASPTTPPGPPRPVPGPVRFTG